MLTSLLLLLSMTQSIACTPGETSMVCNCKYGMVSACVALVGDDVLKAARVLSEVEEALEQASQMEGEKDENEMRQLRTAAETLSHSLGSGEPPNCKGQQHHLISRPIAKKLEDHPTLKGHFQPRDPRYVARAKDEQSHCGYQEWHRQVDKEVIDWLDKHPKATLQEFLEKLREIYSRPELQQRFPNGF